MLNCEKKRLVLVTPSYPPIKGGISDYAQQLARSLSNFFDVSVVTSEGLGESEWKNIFIDSSMLKWRFGETIKLIARLHRLKPEVVLFQDGDDYRVRYVTNLYFLMLIPLFVRVMLRCPVFLIIHEGVGKRQLIQAKFSTGVIVVEKDYENWFSKFGQLKPNVKWIPIGSNIPRVELTSAQREEARLNLGISASERAISFFGFINARKGFDLLVDALELLSTQFKLRLIIVGEPSEQPIRNISFSVNWTGYLEPEEVGRVLASMDVCVFPFPNGASWRYGSLLAALVQDVPVVTAPGLGTDLDGVYEYTLGDQVSLSEKISEALKPSKKINRKIHTWNDIAKWVVDFIQES